jgi:hypothetical protein
LASVLVVIVLLIAPVNVAFGTRRSALRDS